MGEPYRHAEDTWEAIRRRVPSCSISIGGIMKSLLESAIGVYAVGWIVLHALLPYLVLGTFIAVLVR